MTLALELASRINRLDYAGLPDPAVHWAKVGILDTVGVTLAGAREDCARIVEGVAARGGAVDCATLLKLPNGRTATALSIAASLAPGVKANFGTTINVGRNSRL